MREGNDIFNMFGMHFPQYADEIEMWRKEDEHSIRVRRRRGKEFIFTYFSRDKWCFQTAEHYEGKL